MRSACATASAPQPLPPPAAMAANAAAAASAARDAAVAAANAAGGQDVAALAQRVKDLDDQKKRAGVALRLEEKKRARRMERARGLSDADLLSVIADRAARAQQAKGKGKGGCRHGKGQRRWRRCGRGR